MGLVAGCHFFIGLHQWVCGLPGAVLAEGLQLSGGSIMRVIKGGVVVERDIYHAGWLSGYNQGVGDGRVEGRKETRAPILELMGELSDFLDNYADAETDADGHTHGNRAMGLKSRIDELL